MSSAAQVLDIQAELLENLRGKPDLKALTIQQFTEIFKNVDPDEQVLERKLTHLARPMFTNLTLQAAQAHAFHVSADMAGLVTWAASQLDELDRFDCHEAPVGVGIARFDAPLTIIDGRGSRMKVHLLVWAPVRANNCAATVVHLFNSLDDPDQYSIDLIEEHGRPFIVEHFGRWLLASSAILFQDVRMGPAFFPPEHDARGSAEIAESGEIPHEYTNLSRLVYAFWLLLNQTITQVNDETVPRAYARRAERAKLPARVTVVTLRREVDRSEPAGPGGMEYHHRWFCRGHWRRQRYGPGNSLQKRIWVQPFVKGPAGAPFLQSEKVYSLKR